MDTKKSYTRTLINDGGSQRLYTVAYIAKEGFSCYTLHQEKAEKGWKTIARGTSTIKPNFTEAKAFVETVAQKAKAAGWKVPAGPAGYKPAADKFTLETLPSPKPEKKEKAEQKQK